MAQLIGQLGDTLAARSTRRGFLATLGKVALAGAALAAGIAATSGSVLAACTQCSPYCLEPCYNSDCPCGDTEDNLDAFCCFSGSGEQECIPCLTNGQLHCYAIIQVSGGCPHTPSP